MLFALVIVPFILSHAAIPVAPLAIQVAAEYSDHQGFKSFAERARQPVGYQAVE